MADETKILTHKEKGLNRHWKNYVDKDYLGSHNLEKGEEMLLTIAKFEGEEMVVKVGSNTNEKVPKPVLYFVEDVPKMILNMTNANMIASLYGTHPAQWIGKQIQVYAMKGRFFGKEQEALRIRDFVPKHAVDVEKYRVMLEKATTGAELKTLWVSLPASVRNNKEVEQAKDIIKARVSASDTQENNQ